MKDRTALEWYQIGTRTIPRAEMRQYQIVVTDGANATATIYHILADDFTLTDNGHLVFYRQDNIIAIFAPGCWVMLRVLEDKVA